MQISSASVILLHFLLMYSCAEVMNLDYVIPKSCKTGPFVVRSIQCVYKVKKIKTLCKKGIIDKNFFKERLNRLKTKEKSDGITVHMCITKKI